MGLASVGPYEIIERIGLGAMGEVFSPAIRGCTARSPSSDLPGKARTASRTTNAP